MEKVKTISIYEKDLELVKRFQEKHSTLALKDCVRVLVEYSRAHGVLQD